MLSSLGERVFHWLDERLDLQPIQRFVREKSVPSHRYSWCYFFGGATLFFFMIQVATGVLLLLYYKPTAEAAFESVRFIMTEVSFGWLIRSLHSWSANLMVLAAFLHMATVFFMRAYRKPRELTWYTGATLLLLAMGFGFSGYLLPWNELAFFATRVGTDMAGKVPVVGRFLLEFLRGGEDVTGATLTRFFGFHVAVLPMMATALILFHLLAIQRQGMSVPLSQKEASTTNAGMPFFPNYFLRELMGWAIALAILAALASLFPWELGEEADAFAPAPAGIKPEWYFVFMFQTLKLLPATVAGVEGELVGLLAFGLAGLAWFFVPVLDIRSSREEPSRWLTLMGVAALLFIAIMTLLGYVMP
ncbi:MAG TPA: cytochrome b N-terminal domain-containing protein [Vicinamibacteria bacterium]|nr:cytochrome b N-terminal domain-containing protein [Vicinamibacteria bacterium]